jgi:hypothetical protein
MPAHKFLTEPPPAPTPCQAWLYRISRTTNEWWWKTGGDGTYLVLPNELGIHLLNWKGITLSSLYLEAVADALEPFFVAERKALEAELRRLVMDRASDRRLSLSQYPPAPARRPAPRTSSRSVTIGGDQ